MLPIPRTRATALRPALAAWWWRLALCVVACCVGVQGVALSAERVLGGRHVHLPSTHALAQHVSDLDGHRYAPEIFVSSNDPALEHSDVHQHGHDAGVSGVVHIGDDGGAATPNPHATLIRSVHDLDPLIPSLGIVPDDERAQGWAVTQTNRFDSHISPLLERPPQV